MAERPSDFSYDVISDEKLGAGGFLIIRRLHLKVARPDGSRSKEGIYDLVERPFGLDAVVLAIYRRTVGGKIEILLREGARVPLAFGRPETGTAPQKSRAHRPIVEFVAGILEAGEDSLEMVRERAAAEALEEAGFRVAADAVEMIGPPMFPTPGMCPEKFYFAAVEIAAAAQSEDPPGDGSPFEEGARLFWLDLNEALDRCKRGELEDLKTELLIRRLKDRLG